MLEFLAVASLGLTLSLFLGLGAMGVIIAIKKYRPAWPAALIGMVAAAASIDGASRRARSDGDRLATNGPASRDACKILFFMFLFQTYRKSQ